MSVRTLLWLFALAVVIAASIWLSFWPLDGR